MARTRKPQKPQQPRRPGRPSLYSLELCELAAKHYAQGATDVEVADALGIHVATLYRWQHEHPEFREAARVAKEAADDRVERSLYHVAVGYSYDTVRILQHNGKPVVVPYREHVPPDAKAAAFWLKNRQPEKWRDRIEHAGPNGGPIQAAVRVVFEKPADA